MRLILAFCSAKPIWMPKKPKLMFHRPARPCRGFSIASLPFWPLAGSRRVRVSQRGGERASAAGYVYEYVGGRLPAEIDAWHITNASFPRKREPRVESADARSGLDRKSTCLNSSHQSASRM